MCGLKIVVSLCLFFLVEFAEPRGDSDGDDELFQRDIGDQMKIGLSEKGYRKVQLKCGSDSMVVDLETEEDFDGVIYTRGSFYKRNSPCFFDPGTSRNRRTFSIKFPLNDCDTKQVDEVYSNVLVLQHDKELIMPGDAAFNLECDFSKPRDVTLNANLNNDQSVVSRITLTDADPSFKDKNRSKRNSIESLTSTVILTPEFLKQRKEEL